MPSYVPSSAPDRLAPTIPYSPSVYDLPSPPPPPPSRVAPTAPPNPEQYQDPRSPAVHRRHVSEQNLTSENITFDSPTTTEISSPTNTASYGGRTNRARGNSLVPPAPEAMVGGGYRAVSSPLLSRPNSYHSEGETPPMSTRKSWLPGKQRSRNNSQSAETYDLAAWVNAGDNKIIYNSNLLLQGERLPELWNEGPEADTYVYLFPRESGIGPQFKVYSHSLSASQPLTQLMYGEIYSGRARGKSFDGRRSLTIEDATRNLAIRNSATPAFDPRTNATINEYQSATDSSNSSIRSFPRAEGPKEIHLYFPVGLQSTGPHLSSVDTQMLIDCRNLFAFLNGQPLVATPARPTNFRILLSIASFLKQLRFTNIDGSTFGEAVIISTNFIINDLGYADVRGNLNKLLEALILGEQLRSVGLYNEAFAHAAGIFDKLGDNKNALWSEISPITKNKLERASIDLRQRVTMAEVHLTDFEFPSIFSGIGASTSSPEAKIVRFSRWKTHYLAMRKHTIGYYKSLHGSWPPKASSKKNQFVQGGLNRLVLKGLYTDLCSVYDYLVDRSTFTSRGMNEGDDRDTDDFNLMHAALRKLLAEYDRCSPPVQPPVPFDVPLVPDITTVEPGFYNMGPKEQNKLINRKLKDHEAKMLLAKSYNLKLDSHQPFLDSFKQFEGKEASGMNAQELGEMRYGYWIFIYAVLQALPMLVMDVPGLKYTNGVESFLCQPPLGGLPWMEDSGAVKMSWYGVQNGGAIVSLPSDVVNYGVEATYRRSHCWTAAERWLSGELDEEMAQETPDLGLSPLSPPPGFAGGELGLRPSVRRRQSENNLLNNSPNLNDHRRTRSRQDLVSQRQSIALGLERLPIPAGEEAHFSPPLGYGSRPGSPGTGAVRPASRGTSPVGNNALGIMSGQERRSPSLGAVDESSPSPSLKGSTFDDILGTMPEKEKKSRWRI